MKFENIKYSALNTKANQTKKEKGNHLLNKKNINQQLSLIQEFSNQIILNRIKLISNNMIKIFSTNSTKVWN
ncbi:hypothetical protein TTHERM_00415710 (macronuclear) [Tetrahymena thermophila SB210]|uniref:Uncharacterized protein n=1 Tax=Tetrahymena thermophila (strain SB210) TaxID=312017 RepID=Q22P22_TETTS|nr:hypothetical protein TTHERM_00415710 [Tetrahymena thermophila SB210]EAR86989.1 hypothetical protein TTHERM_00415710 [Tetrahymena thermophila SB210]|eukprot:XP_001007234.1 hypothetical protein TTHERM_00415710 [Tetrahymena thermophila SB210]